MGCAASSPADEPGAVAAHSCLSLRRPHFSSELGGSIVSGAGHSRCCSGRPASQLDYDATTTTADDVDSVRLPPPPVLDDPSRVWLPELIHRYAGFLPHNEVTCTLRLVNKAAAEQFRTPSYTTVLAREAVPHHYFVCCWADPSLSAGSGRGGAGDSDGEAGYNPDVDSAAAGDGSGGDRNRADDVRCNGDVRRLTWLQRMTLLVRTAASGSIPNLEVLLAQRERFPPHSAALVFASDAGQLEVCVWLRQRGAFHWNWNVGYAAARRGDAAIVKWVVEDGGDWGFRTLCGAAVGGHVGLVHWLLERCRNRRGPRAKVAYDVMESVAEGCDLATLQFMMEGASSRIATEIVYSDLTAHAAVSPNPDWREKVAWLESRGHRPSSKAAEMVSERLVDGGAAAAAGAAGSLEADDEERGGGDATATVQPLPADGAAAGSTASTTNSNNGNNGSGTRAADSCVVRLTWLRERGYPMTVAAARAAARVGNLPALRYLLGPGGVRLDEQLAGDLVDLACAAARGGHSNALKLLQEHGAPVTKRRVLGMAVLGGRLEAVVWLVKQISALGLVGAAAAPQAGVLDLDPADVHVSGGGGGGSGGGPASQVQRQPPMSPALAAAFADGGVMVPELIRELAVLAVMSCCPPGLPRLQQLDWSSSSSGTAAPLPPNDLRVSGIELLAWLYEQGLAELHAGVFKLAAQYGDLRLMTWLYERGCPWDARAFAAAAHAGGEAQLEWLARHGCPIGDDGEPYIRAAIMSDQSTLRCLRRLGCPWSESGDTFTQAALASGPGHNPVRLASLQALLQVGCPVDWGALRTALKDKEGTSKQRRRVLRALLEEERRRRWRDGAGWTWACVAARLRGRGGGSSAGLAAAAVAGGGSGGGGGGAAAAVSGGGNAGGSGSGGQCGAGLAAVAAAAGVPVAGAGAVVA